MMQSALRAFVAQPSRENYLAAREELLPASPRTLDAADLDCRIALLFLRFDLGHRDRCSINHGRGKGLTVFGIYSKHFALCSKDEFHDVAVGPPI